MSRYDVAVIGTGPGGISAAITLNNRNKNTILFGRKNLSEKIEKGHTIRNYPGLPDITGPGLMKAFSDHLNAMGIEINEDRIQMIYDMGDYFSILGEDSSNMYEASAVIIATGVVTGGTLPGEEEFLGKGVSSCATCDAALFKGKDVIVLGYAGDAAAECAFLAETSGSVTYFPMNGKLADVPEGVNVVNEKPLEILKDGRMTVKTGENKYEADGVFVLRDAVPPGRLVPGLEVDGAHIAVDRSMKTNIPGLFACGDITGTPYQYVKSAGEGNVAALSAAAFLDSTGRK
ncbi:MAG: NAD(P)/FAD-dependent oxidoreductase [Lachnospiraceae bacterium]|nr:NAD(P)/FAD-dependent oxidoreductase [Lachnospiraceae bacterium]